jgi:tRNA A-37 threonylcarbamoyl transferase component Bud32
MARENTCPHCGKPVPPTAPGGICPECMLKAGLASQTEAGETGPHGTKILQPPQKPEEIAGLFPQLEILECLGRGGMGVVYKARQPKLNRLVALKVLARERQQDARFTERFAREAQALARLNHPNIVTVYDFGEAGNHCYLLMEYVDGLGLRQLIQSGKLKPAEALAIVPRICEALQYAHEQGIVHRDIKPENILLDKQGRVKIADFGIAKMMDVIPLPRPSGIPSPSAAQAAGARSGSLTEGHAIGTPQYMAPEQIERPQEVDHRADIYSLGVVFYEMLTGELPLGKFAPPSRKVEVDVRLDEVVLRALEKEPERRYQHASEVKTDVENITSSRPGAPDSATPGNGWKLTTLLFNPFVRVTGVPALFLGWLAILVAGWLGSLGNTHFDGVLDTHLGMHVPLWVFLSEGFIDWLCLGLVLLVFGKGFSKASFRAIDLLGTQALARWPTIFLSLVLMPKALQRFSNYVLEQLRQGGEIKFNTADAFVTFAIIVAAIPLTCWVVALMYKSYSVSCRLRGTRGAWTFIPGLLLAEVLSKIAIYALLKAV